MPTHRLGVPCFTIAASPHRLSPVQLRQTASFARRQASCALSRDEAVSLVDASATALLPAFREVDAATKGNLRRVLDAFHAERVGPQHFAGVDGYGHGDLGRESLDAIYARIFECESAAVRIQFMSGTHAIASVLYGVLRPGDHVLSAAGPVYDTLEEVLGTRSSLDDAGSLRDWGVNFDAVPLTADGGVDFDAVATAVSEHNSRLVFIQRSFGYSWRPVLSIADITEIIRRVKKVRPDCICFVDNCYGEFLEPVEPVHPSVGADVMAGSLIKNLGGGIAPSGAYVAGREDIVERALARLTAPGVGGGATLGMNRTLFHGLFLAPQMVGEASKGAMLVGHTMRELGYETNPGCGDERGFVQAVRLGCADRVFAFCRAVQRNGPVGSYIEPTQVRLYTTLFRLVAFGLSFSVSQSLSLLAYSLVLSYRSLSACHLRVLRRGTEIQLCLLRGLSSTVPHWNLVQMGLFGHHILSTLKAVHTGHIGSLFLKRLYKWLVAQIVLNAS
jgi:cystathionine beta-lyase family protein involved in aluminum resistance